MVEHGALGKKLRSVPFGDIAMVFRPFGLWAASVPATAAVALAQMSSQGQFTGTTDPGRTVEMLHL